MTLVLMAINSRGVWQCSDRRVTLRQRGKPEKVIDDDSIKHVDLRFGDGNALVAYAGLAYLHKRHVSEWLAEILIGKRFTIMEALEHIRDRATADIGDSAHHAFLFGGFQNRQPWVAAVTNYDPQSDFLSAPARRTFEMGGSGVESPMGVLCRRAWLGQPKGS